MLWVPIIGIAGVLGSWYFGFRGKEVGENPDIDETPESKLWRTYPHNYPNYTLGEKIHWNMSQPTFLTWLFIIPFISLILYTVRFIYIRKIFKRKFFKNLRKGKISQRFDWNRTFPY